ncbi:hypothetical protein Acr_00g0010900 [Actinidia rufa]|uniref:Leucine-rich repeat-containing N-terminal plant-type domain-containing protein n=1 Tax=Actinidia rufa TaxID=165716 RepID=A0A7J0D998_9ERIC|nr:hypothetical protein Acr_00g0010900 [Actinidia rufa]
MGEKCIQLLHFSVVLLVFYGNTPAVGASSEDKIRCTEREKQALLQFKEDVKDHDSVLSSWGSEEDKRDCCKWRGVRCNNRTGHVTKIDLSSSYLSGKLLHLRAGELALRSKSTKWSIQYACVLWLFLEGYYCSSTYV